MSELELEALGVGIRLRHPAGEVGRLIEHCYGALGRSEAPSSVGLEIEISVPEDGVGYRVSVDAGPRAGVSETGVSETVVPETVVPDLVTLVSVVDDEIVLGLQHARADLMFLHAAVVGSDGCALTVVGASGSGKSTLCLELVAAGLAYWSDELAPIEPRSKRVFPFRRAVCLKERRADAPLARGRLLDSGGWLHLRMDRLGGGDPTGAELAGEALPLGALFVLDPPEGRSASERSTPMIEPLSTATAVVRLYPHLLNALAHGNGIDAALGLCSGLSCFRLEPAAPRATSELILETLRTL